MRPFHYSLLHCRATLHPASHETIYDTTKGVDAMNRGSFVSGACLLALSTALAAEAPEGESTLKEIIVTAQKRAQSLQSVPLSVSALDEDALRAADVVRLDTVKALVPSFHVGQTQAYFFTSIRGVGDTNFSIVSDPAVPFYVDGLYYPRANGPNAVLFDVDRIEVLRGPQGTLYGRNATGGVVNVIPKQPGSEFGGDLSLQVGNYDAVRVTGAVDLPLSDRVQTRIAGIYNSRDGYTDNLPTTPGGDDTIDRVDDIAVRGIMKIEASEDLHLRFASSYFKGNGGSVAQKYIGPHPGTPAYVGTTPNPTDPHEIYNDGRSHVDLEDVTFFAESALDIGAVTWSTQLGYLDQSAHRLADIDGSERFIQNSEALVETDLATVESRLAGEHGALQWLAGVFYLTEDARNVIESATPTGPFLRINAAENTSAAVFGEGTLALTDRLSVTLGARHTRDDKEGSSITLAQPGNPPNPPPASADLSFKETTWRVGTEFSLAPGKLLYATISKGYKAGGFNFVEATPYRPENLTSYEIGAKTTFPEQSLVLNVAAFHYDYEDLQLNQLTPPVPPAVIGTVQVTNAASTRTYGAEIEFNWSPIGQLELAGFVAWLDAKFQTFRNDDSRIPGTLFEDLAGNRPAFSPPWSVSVIASYPFNLPGGYELTPRLIQYWQDNSSLREFNRDIEQVPAYFKTDLSLDLTSPGGRWTLGAFVNNAGDEDVLNYVAVGSPTVGFRYAGTYNPPRTFGVRFGMDF
jgi:iron complex outermembrane receptor protein